MYKKILLLIIAFPFFNNLTAQQFGGFPASKKWKQVNSDTARVIFSAPTEEQAQQIAAILHKMAKQKNNSIGDQVRKINVVLHNNTTLANGYVGLGPYRSEFYLVPGSDIFSFGNLPWHEQLAIHEYRHVQQYNNFNNGLSKVAGFILGEEGQALANSATVPDWFFEGDAVFAETLFTPQGRGRIPFFFNGYKSLWREGRDYSWMKLRNGSLKDYVPNHYQLGYLLVNYGYLKYGEDFWQKVTKDASSFKGLFYPFQKAIKAHSGINFKAFRKEALDFYSHQVSVRRTDKEVRETVANYYFPQYISDDSLLYLKNTFKNIDAFYIRDSRGEHRVALKNIGAEDWFSYRDGTIAYTAYDVNARWTLEDYNNIILYNIYTNKEKKLTTKEKYFTPDISPSGNHVIAVSVNDSIQSELRVLDIETGEVTKKFFTPSNTFFFQPRFIDDNSAAVFVRMPDATISLHRIDLNTGREEKLIASTPATIGFPFIHNNTIYFTGSFAGNDDLYSLTLKDKKVYKLTSGQTGSYYPSVTNDSLTWSRFTSNGLRIRSSALADLQRTEVNPLHLGEIALPYRIANADDALNILRSAQTIPDYPVGDYKQSFRLFNFHSWRPYYEDPEFSFTLYSDNILNTFSNQLYYKYNQNENSHGVGLTTSYGGLFPVLTAGAEYLYDRHINTPTRSYLFNQFELQGGAYIPLNFTSGNTYKFLTFGSNYVFNRLMPAGHWKDSLATMNTTYLRHFITWRQQLPRAIKQIFPRFGYTTTAEYRHRLDEGGYQILNTGQVYLPSPFQTHSIVVAGAFQQTDTSNLLFSNRFANSRGYLDYYFSRMWKVSGNYHFPIIYPDRGIANIVYLLRVRGNVFIDMTRVYSNDKLLSADMRSTGAEIFFDTKWWNQLPVSFGIRVSHLLDNGFHPADTKGSTWFEFIMPVGLIPD